ETDNEAEQKTADSDLDGSFGEDSSIIDFTYGTETPVAETKTAESETAPAEDDRFADVDVNWDEFYSDSDNKVYTPSEPQDEERDFTDYVAMKENQYDSVNWQHGVSALDKRQTEIGEYIIGMLDDDGYLRVPME